RPRSPQPGVPIDVTVPLRATSAVVPAGWRVRLSLSGADFPVVWPPPRSFTLIIEPSASRLRLPVAPARDPGRRLTLPAAGEQPPAPSELARSVSGWETIRDGNRTVFRRDRASVEHQPEREGLTYEAEQWWTVSVDDDDPGSTVAATWSQAALRRTGWEVATEGTIRVSGREAFEVTVELAASLDGETVFERAWGETIPREWV
ncbi:MAG: CocE/NonD family hydrolase C-terminal non-catalytic domain-containing protein, partial [Acidimicrobiia bacterium]